MVDTIYISSMTMNEGTQGGNIADAQSDNSAYFYMDSVWDVKAGLFHLDGDMNLSIAPAGRAFNISYHVDIDTSWGVTSIYINGSIWKGPANDHDADDQFKDPVNSSPKPSFYSYAQENENNFQVKVYFWKMVEVAWGHTVMGMTPAKFNGMDVNQNSKILGVG